MRTALMLLVISLSVWSCQTQQKDQPVVVIETGYGDITIELFTQQAPKTAGNFLRYVEEGRYNRSHFYRVLSTDNQPMGTDAAELIQGGLYVTQHGKDTIPPTPHEPTSQTGLSHTHGTVSLARQAPGTGGTEFFICIGNQPGFDFGGTNNPDGQGYAAFGRVTAGMDVVQKIYRQPEENQLFQPPVPIIRIRRP